MTAEEAGMVLANFFGIASLDVVVVEEEGSPG
jgi:hypothetical protein